MVNFIRNSPIFRLVRVLERARSDLAACWRSYEGTNFFERMCFCARSFGPIVTAAHASDQKVSESLSEQDVHKQTVEDTINPQSSQVGKAPEEEAIHHDTDKTH